MDAMLRDEGGRRILHARKVEPLRRCRRAGVLIVARGEQPGKVGDRPALEGDVHHRAHQHPDHMVKEPVGLHVKFHAAVGSTGPPFGELDLAEMMRARLPANAERLEVMFAGQEAGAFGEQLGAERPAQCPLERMPERRSRGLVGADHVTITPEERTLAGVKAVRHLMDRSDPAIGREQRVEGTVAFRRRPA